jgi:hypothetical protein
MKNNKHSILPKPIDDVRKDLLKMTKDVQTVKDEVMYIKTEIIQMKELLKEIAKSNNQEISKGWIF